MERSITECNFPFSLLVKEIARSKNSEFSDLLPFPVPITGKVPFLFLLVTTGRKIDSDLSEL